MNNRKLLMLVQNALVAALYTVLGVALAPIAFGAAQCRIPEALTLLPVLLPHTAVGVTIGCALTNFVGAASGMNFLGFADVFIGSATTLAAALLTVRLRHIRWRGLPLLASLPPVLLNAVVVGAEWCFITTGGFPLLPLLGYCLLVGAGQLVSCTVLGVVMVYAIEKTGALKKLLSRTNAAERD